MTDKRKELVEKIRCPVDWSVICPGVEFADVLRYCWFKTVQKYEWYKESDLLRTDDWQPNEWYIEEIFGPVEIDSALENIARWRDAACTEYLGNFTRFAKLRAASDRDYDKHYCPANSSDKEVAELSITRRESVLYPRTDVVYQERVAWAALLEVWFTHDEASIVDIEDLWDREVVVNVFKAAFACHSMRIAMRVDAAVGCTAGNPSNWLLLDYDFSTPIVHAYPISPEEAHQEPYCFRAVF